MEIRGFEGRIKINRCAYIPDKPFGAVTAVDRQALVELLAKCTELQRKRGGVIAGFDITMPCGYSRSFTNNCDIPFEDLPCKCGQEGHYLIKYKKEYSMTNKPPEPAPLPLTK